MNLARLIRSLVVLAIVSASMRWSSVPAWGDDQPAGKPKTARELDALIDALANRNPPPKIVEYPAEWEAVFDANYDWKEQDRVVAAIDVVVKNAGLQMWERLYAHANDERYCLTFNDHAANADENATNWTVGQFCRKIAWSQFSHPVEAATKATRVGERPLRLPLEAVQGMPNWGQPLDGKSLVDFQVQACRQAINDLPKLAAKAQATGRDARTDPQTLRQSRARLEAAVEKLKKNKTPLLGEFRFTEERFDRYDAKRAAEMRSRHNAESPP